MNTETTAKPYAICTTEGCGVVHADREAMREHQKQTMTRVTGTPGVLSRSHSSRVVNPTPEEQAQNLTRSVVGSAIKEATDRAYEELDREIDNGLVTEEAVTAELRNYPDFSDGWDEWRREAAS